MKFSLLLLRRLLILSKLCLCWLMGPRPAPNLNPVPGLPPGNTHRSIPKTSRTAPLNRQTYFTTSRDTAIEPSGPIAGRLDLLQRIHLIIVAPVEYLFQSDSCSLFGANSDADSLEAVAREHLHLASLTVLKTEDAHTEKILRLFRQTRAGPGEWVWVVFLTHGILEQGRLMVAAYESTPALMSSFLKVEDILEALAETSFCLTLDICFAEGALPAWNEAVRVHPDLNGMVIGSAGINQVALDQNSFCRHLTRVLCGGGAARLQTSSDMHTVFELTKREFNFGGMMFIDETGQVPFLESNGFNPVVSRR